MEYYRPLIGFDGPRLADGWCRIAAVEKLNREGQVQIIPIEQAPDFWLENWLRPRADFAGLPLSRPSVMGILNITPDSFSDGGKWQGDAALAQANAMLKAGADLLDIGGESTRPGAKAVPPEEEVARILPAVTALAKKAVLSIDTRKSPVAETTLAAGARIINDVSGLNYDAGLAPVIASADAGLILMHSQDTPENMQLDPHYDNVLLDVYDALEAAIRKAEAAGIPRARIMVDPGIGFGKTLAHNLEILRRISIFHGLGCGVLLGISRKGMIGKLSGQADPSQRDAGTIALTLAAIGQGIQMHRVHDVGGVVQAIKLWQAVA